MSAVARTWLDEACALTREMLAAAAAGDLESVAALEARRHEAFGCVDEGRPADAERLRELHRMNEDLIGALKAMRRRMCAEWDSSRRARAALLGYGRVVREG